MVPSRSGVGLSGLLIARMSLDLPWAKSRGLNVYIKPSPPPCLHAITASLTSLFSKQTYKKQNSYLGETSTSPHHLTLTNFPPPYPTKRPTNPLPNPPCIPTSSSSSPPSWPSPPPSAPSPPPETSSPATRPPPSTSAPATTTAARASPGTRVCSARTASPRTAAGSSRTLATGVPLATLISVMGMGGAVIMGLLIPAPVGLLGGAGRFQLRYRWCCGEGVV